MESDLIILCQAYLSMKTASVIVGVIAVYLSYIAFGHYLVYLKVVYAAFQELRNMPQEHIDDFFEAYKHLEERTHIQSIASYNYLF